MRMISFFLFVAFMSAHASGTAQPVTLSGKGLSLKEIFASIREQTGYVVFANNAYLSNTRPLDLDIRNMPLKDALRAILRDQPLEVEIREHTKTIILSRKPALSLIDMISNQQPVRGQVTSVNASPLAGASIMLKGGKASVIADEQGNFTIDANVGDVLVITFVGFKTKEIKIEAASLGRISLEPATSDLAEIVINKGYYKENRRLSTGSVGRISGDEISRQPVSNPLSALYGKVPGLSITQVTGMPGGNFDIQIRGQNSLRNGVTDNGNIPLYVVDGVPFNTTPMNTSASSMIYPPGVGGRFVGVTGASPFNTINPADIASIEVLKDADATAIYGSRGANGVILITTRKGAEGEMKVDANVYRGAGKVTRRMKLLHTTDYITMRKEAFANDGITTYPSWAYDINGTWDQQAYTDWQKELIGGTADATDVQIALSGGTANTQYRVGGGYHRETTVFPGDFSDRRVSAHFSLSNTSPDKRFSSQIAVNYSVGKSNLFSSDLTNAALTLAPNNPALLDANGELLWADGVNNPLQYMKVSYDADVNSLIASANLSYKILPGLTARSSFGYTNALRKELTKDPIRAHIPMYQMYFVNTSYFGNTPSASWIVEPQLDYSKIAGRHTFNVLLGSTFQHQNRSSLQQTATGFTSEALMGNISAVPAANVFSQYTASLYRYSAIYGRLNYTYDNRYVINFTGRRDGSSRFGPGRQFANFVAAGAAWIFSEESFVKERLPLLSFGKLRGSYGSTGSDQTKDYNFLDLYNPSFTYNGIQGLGPAQLYNPNYAWEENRKLELALDLGFLDDKLMFSATWYRNRSGNQLVGYPLPPSTGFPSVTANLDAVVQNKGWEFILDAKPVSTAHFSWNTTVNLSIPRSKLLSFPNIEGTSYNSQYAVGEPMQLAKTLRYLGVNPATGLYEVEDVDKNGVYNQADMVVNKFVGQFYSGGWSNHLRWKKLEADILLQFVKQNGRNPFGDFSLPGGGLGNQPVEVMQRWQKEGDRTNVQKFTADFSTYGLYGNSDKAITDASFIRLKNLSLSYMLLDRSGKTVLNQARVYLQAQNLFTITRYKGLDPETQGTVLPPLRMIAAGIQVTL